MDEDLLVFNGIDATTGQYLIQPTRVGELVEIALRQSIPQSHLSELSYRFTISNQPDFAPIPEIDDPSDISKSGWGIIFPADANSRTVDMIQEALRPLLDHRKELAGDLFKVYRGSSGYRAGESKDGFLARHGTGPGPVDPAIVPYYLLIIGDPESIPFEFQYELDVQYAVGRLYFERLEEFSHYAQSVVSAEIGGARLPRKAAFFSVANQDDRATEFSSNMLVEPLRAYVEKRFDQLGWGTEVISASDADKQHLLELLGGKNTPAFLFTASHGLGFPPGHRDQIPYQGALLCDTRGPIPQGGVLPRDFFVAGEDISSDAHLLGMISFHFACFGAGTPRLDAYATGRHTRPQPLAKYSFLSALPKRMLSHPNGTALAVVGHVERAWSYSFKWREAGKQTQAFESILYQLLKGKTVGEAMDYMNLRYAEIATLLTSAQLDSQYMKVEDYQLAGLWTAHNDARGFMLLGDPAVKTPHVERGVTGEALLESQPVEIAGGNLPQVLGLSSTGLHPQNQGARGIPRDLSEVNPVIQPNQSPPVYSVLDAWLEMSERYNMEQAEAFGLREDLAEKALEIYQFLTRALSGLTSRLAQYAEDVSGLDVATYVSENLDDVTYEKGFKGDSKVRAITHIHIDGDTEVCVPINAGELDDSLWQIHNQMVANAMKNRMEMLKSAVEMLVSLLGVPSKKG